MTKHGSAQWGHADQANPLVAVGDAELARWPGVSWSRHQRGKHPAVVLTFNGTSRFVIYSSTPGDGRRAADGHLRDIRGVLRELGAQRTQPAKAATEKRRARRAPPQMVRLEPREEPLRADPSRDPWLALAGFQCRDRTPVLSWWRRLWRAVLEQETA